MKHLSTLVLLLAVLFTSCKDNSKTSSEDGTSAVAEPYKLQQTVYYGGDIVTMAGDTPNYVEAVVQREGRIIFTGSKADAMARFKRQSRLSRFRR